MVEHRELNTNRKTWSLKASAQIQNIIHVYIFNTYCQYTSTKVIGSLVPCTYSQTQKRYKISVLENVLLKICVKE